MSIKNSNRHDASRYHRDVVSDNYNVTQNRVFTIITYLEEAKFSYIPKSNGKYNKLTKALIIGGTSMEEQSRVLDKGVDVLIATPGRLLDLYDRGGMLLNDVKILVIDEADRMLDMGFVDDVLKIISFCRNPHRQTLLFSATVSDSIKRIIQKHLKNPVEVNIGIQLSPASTVKHTVFPIGALQKFDLLIAFMKNLE